MKKYNLETYIRYKEDLKESIPSSNSFMDLSRDELIVKFLPLVENLARKFPSSEQSIGILTINDLIQIGSEGLIRAVDKIDRDRLSESEDIEKTLSLFFSKGLRVQ